ncbi:MAG: GGDEF domain-containing protein [Abditibacteriota bacterium]|nr:GGDEF domain-containing protein [Abditibacteriota bacterium]
MRTQQIHHDNSHDSDAFDVYTDKIYGYILNLAAVGMLCSGIFYTSEYFAGNLAHISFGRVLLLDAFDILLVILAGCASRSWRAKRAAGAYPTAFLRTTKLILCLLLCLHWNYIAYSFPSRELWGFTPYYVLLTLLFFDYRVMDFLCTLMAASIVVSFMHNRVLLYPAQEADFIVSVALRVVCILLTFLLLHVLAYLGNKMLVRALEEAVEKDPLTGLLNRRRMDLYQKKYYDNAVSHGASLSMAVIDIDNFKQINDTYTHKSGDYVLKTVAGIIRINCGEGELAFRWGGEEMLILSSGSKEELMARCEHIRREIEDAEMQLVEGEPPVKVTVTAGLAAYKEGMSLSEVFLLADENMYVGKRGTKNVVVG